MHQNQLSITNVFIIINITLFALCFFYPILNYFLSLNFYFTKGLYYQPLSAMFMHGGVLHLLFNMIVLYQFGNAIEQIVAKMQYIILYIGGGVLINIASFVVILEFYPHSNMIGASGAICMLVALYAYIAQENIKQAILWIFLITFAPMLLGLNIAWWAHLIGAFLGFGIGFILTKKHYN